MAKADKSIIIGLGGCGSTIARDLHQRLLMDNISNAELHVFNSSYQDMKGLRQNEYYIIGSGEGAGKDPALAHQMFDEEVEKIEQVLVEIKGESNVTDVSIVFNSGGGTGSGFSLGFVKLAKKVFDTAAIIVTAIKPLEVEDIPRVNSINNLMEFSAMLARKEIVYNIIDNQVLADSMNSTDFTKINEKIVDNICMFSYSYLEKHSKPSSSFNLDKRDFYRVVSQKNNTAGIINVYGYRHKKVEPLNCYSGLGIEFAGARKVLAIVKDSKHIGDVTKALKAMGDITVFEFKSLAFDDKVANGSFDAIIYAIGEPKSDEIVDLTLDKFNATMAQKESMKKKDGIKENLKQKSVRKLKIGW